MSDKIRIQKESKPSLAAGDLCKTLARTAAVKPGAALKYEAPYIEAIPSAPA